MTTPEETGPELKTQLVNELLAHGEFGTTEGRNRANAETCADALIALLPPTPPKARPEDGWLESERRGFYKLDTAEVVRFYEQDFYVLSNFSAFAVEWSGFVFPTSEHLYHWLRFTLSEDLRGQTTASLVHRARSAHDAFKIAQDNKAHQISDWDSRKVATMKRVLHAKADQHEYVRRKLLATGDRLLIEDSWRDDFWGWGPNRDGQNMLGKLWMEVRSDIAIARAAGHPASGDDLWSWLAEQRGLELDWGGEDDEVSWRVHQVSGGYNDREWTLIASGETPLEAVALARDRAAGGGE